MWSIGDNGQKVWNSLPHWRWWCTWWNWPLLNTLMCMIPEGTESLAAQACHLIHHSLIGLDLWLETVLCWISSDALGLCIPWITSGPITPKQQTVMSSILQLHIVSPHSKHRLIQDLRVTQAVSLIMTFIYNVNVVQTPNSYTNCHVLSFQKKKSVCCTVLLV